MFKDLTLLLIILVLYSSCESKSEPTLKEIWKTKIASDYYFYSVPNATNSTVAFATQTGEVHGYSTEDGHKKWATKIGQGPPNVNMFEVYDNNIYYDYINLLISFNGETGNPDWTFVKSLTYGSLSSPEPTDQYVFCGDSGTNEGPDVGDIYCVNRSSGTLVWKKQLNSKVRSIKASSDGFVYVGTSGSYIDPQYGSLFVGYVYCFNSETGDSIWSFDVSHRPNAGLQSGDVAGKPAIWNNNLYVVNSSGSLFCLDRMSGIQKWVVDLPSGTYSGGAYCGVTIDSSSSLGAGVANTVYFCFELGTGKLKWSQEDAIPGTIFFEPIMHNNAIYTTSGVISPRDLTTGKVLYRSDPNSSYRFGNLVNGTLYMLGEDYIYAFKPPQ